MFQDDATVMASVDAMDALVAGELMSPGIPDFRRTDAHPMATFEDEPTRIGDTSKFAALMNEAEEDIEAVDDDELMEEMGEEERTGVNRMPLKR